MAIGAIVGLIAKAAPAVFNGIKGIFQNRKAKKAQKQAEKDYAAAMKDFQRQQLRDAQLFNNSNINLASLPSTSVFDSNNSSESGANYYGNLNNSIFS